MGTQLLSSVFCSTYTTCTGTGLWGWILPQLCLPVFTIQQHTQVKFVKYPWKNDTQAMCFDSQKMCMSYLTGLLKRLALNHGQLCSSQPLLLPLSYCDAWRQGRVCQLLGRLNVLHLYIANLCEIRHKCTNVELHLQSELSFLQERAFHLTVSVVIWDEVHWEGELLQKAPSYSFESTAIWNSLKENNRSYSNRLWAQGQT